MMALAILSIALVTILKTGGQNLSMIYNANTLTTASFLAQQKLAELETSQDNAIINTKGEFGKEFPGFQWKASLTLPSTPLGSARRLEVSVLWTEGEQERKFVLGRYVE